MRINPVGFRYNNINFGHSKKSQEYIEEKASKMKNKKFADALLKTSELCNEMEDCIKKQESNIRTQDEENAFRAYVDLFVTVKSDLLDIVMCEFSDDSGKYLESEEKYYKNSDKHYKESGRYNFRKQLLRRIATWNYDSDAEKDRILYGTDKKVKDEKQTAQIDAKVAANDDSKKEVVSENQNATETDKIASTTDLAYYLLLKNRPAGVLVDVMRKEKNSPNGFSDVMGMNELKEELREEIINPIQNPKQAELDLVEYGKEIPKGILLYGPPGCGKTYVVQALASEIDSPIYKLGIDKAGSKFINETSNNIRTSFDYVERMAKVFQKPVILFMDEIDSLVMNRTSDLNEENIKQVATLLQCIEHAQQNNVIVVGASNKYDLIDPAAIRRFPMKRPVLAPEVPKIKEHLKGNLEKRLKGQKLLADEKALDVIASALCDYSYKSINVISDEASELARKRGRADISVGDYKKAIENTNEEKVDNSLYIPMKKSKIGFSQGAF